MKHLSLREMVEVLNGGGSMEHLDSCGICVKRIAAIKEFQQNVSGAAFLEGRGGSGCLSLDEIAVLIDGDEVEENEAKREHLQNCDYCFENAAYYHSESEAMKREEIPETPPAYLRAGVNILPVRKRKAKKSSWLKRYILYPLPAYATAVILWFFIFFTPPQIDVEVISGGSQYILFSNLDATRPYFYFGKTGEQIGALPALMKIKPAGSELEFQWKAVEGALEYHFILQDVTTVAPRTLLQLKTAETQVTIPSERISPERIYRWIVAGGLPGDRHFVGEVDFRLEK